MRCVVVAVVSLALAGCSPSESGAPPTVQSSDSATDSTVAAPLETGPEFPCLSGSDGVDYRYDRAVWLVVGEQRAMAHFISDSVPSCPPETTGTVMAGDGFPLDPDTVHLEATVGDTVEIEAPGYAATDIGVRWTPERESGGRSTGDVESTGPGVWVTQVPLEPGTYRMSVSFDWPGGEAGYVARVNVG